MKLLDVPQHVLDLIKLSEAGPSDEWAEPEPLTQQLKPVPAMTDAMLPPPLRPWIKDVAYRMQCPVDFVATAAIAALGAVVGTGCTVRPKQLDNWTVVPNIWGAIVAQPGSKKSPAISQAHAPIAWLNHEAQQAFTSSHAQYRADAVARELEIANLKAEIKKLKPGQLVPATPGGPATRDPRQELMALLQTPLVEPKPKRYYTNNSTIEALEGILETNPRGVMVLCDELTGWINSFERSGREGERQGYLTAWNGADSHHVDRVGRGSIYIENFCVAVFGGIQPDMLEHYLYEAKSEHRNDGLIQRLQLLVYPDIETSTSLIDAIPDTKATQAALSIFKTLAGDLTALAPTTANDGTFFHFEAEHAQGRFNQWYVDLHATIANDDDSLIKEHLNKYTKLVPALALLFHLVDIADDMSLANQPIPLTTLERAIAWGDYLEVHARRVYGMATNYACWRHLNIDPPCRFNIDPGRVADSGISNCG
ncbi:YfjI family protein [Hydrogenophaga atypica]|uniref:YfjI family protein n=1 Tax=Hydrogenophaga atypica TaxID=249409 RepID=A0ABW2QR51_9BURK